MMNVIVLLQQSIRGRETFYGLCAASLVLLLMIFVQLNYLGNTAKSLFSDSPEQDVLLQMTRGNKQLAKVNKKVTPKAIPDISQWHVFGNALTAPVSLTEVPKTLLALTLTGVFIKDAAKSQAIIASADGTEQTYHVGDEVPGAGKIEQISANGVLFLREGQLESLVLNDEQGNDHTQMQTEQSPYDNKTT